MAFREGEASGLALISAFSLGAGLMFLLDPASRRRRRAMLRDKAVHLTHEAQYAVNVGARDLANRSKGVIARSRSRLFPKEVSDGILVDRVRTRLGRCVSHPHAVHVTVDNGAVTLLGPVLSHEVDVLLAEIARVPGVRDVKNSLEPHATPERISALQGGTPRHGPRPDFLQQQWAPATKLLVGLGGGVLLLGFLGFGGLEFLSRVPGLKSLREPPPLEELIAVPA